MAGLFTRMTITVAIIVVIAEGVEYWRGMAYPEQQWWIVPLIMFLTILAIMLNLWLLMKKYNIYK
jgi:hypothetical protein